MFLKINDDFHKIKPIIFHFTFVIDEHALKYSSIFS